MPKGKAADSKSNDSGLNFEAQLWAATEQAVPASHYGMTEYKRARPEGLCLGLIFLEYISDAFEEKREQLLFGFSDPKSEWFIKDEPQRAEAAENRDFFSLSASIGERAGVRCRFPSVPPEARWHTINAKAKSPEIGMNRRGVQNLRGQKWPCASTTTWKLARMNLAIRGIDANLGPRNADSFRTDLHPDLKADFILANPPFNMSDWGGENLRQDVRYFSLSASNGERVGVRCRIRSSPVNNANFAWVQHFIHHLAPATVAGSRHVLGGNHAR